MSWKASLVSAYYHSTAPLRQARLRRLSALGRAPAMVLFYHRVADDRPNDWTISPAAFAKQLQWIGKRFRWATLDEIVERLAVGTLTEPLVHVTFDDGYADNMRCALPLLRDWGVPYTYFVSTEHVFQGKAFEHDVRRGVPLEPNSPDDLQRIVDWGGEVGSHTKTHCDLGAAASAAQIEDEIEGSRDQLVRLLGRPIRYFAFPFGMWAHLSVQAFRVARRAGFRACCSAYGGYNFPGEDPFHVQRIHGDPQLSLVKNWLTLDPRKLSMTQRFAWGGEHG